MKLYINFLKTIIQYYYFINLFKLRPQTPKSRNQKLNKFLMKYDEIFLTLIPCYFIICFNRVNKIIKKFTFQDEHGTYNDFM